MRREVPAYGWGCGLPSDAVGMLLDLADACNDAEAAYADARLAEIRAQTAVEIGGRQTSAGPQHRAWVASWLYPVAGQHAESVLRVYLAAAAKLAVAASVQLQARLEQRPVPVADIDEVRGSHIYADPALVPRLAAGDDYHRDEMLDAHARVLKAVAIGQHHQLDPSADVVDPEHFDRHRDYTILEYGAQDLAEALHDYGGHCLWALASLTRQPGDQDT
jgi:hypothetical protein